jgi:outer membrane lipoprotein-sorting protein
MRGTEETALAGTADRRTDARGGAAAAGRALALAGLLLAGIPVVPMAAAAAETGGSAPELDALAGCLARDGRVEVAFREERLVQQVDETLTSRGRFVFEPPRRLIKIVEAPRRERAVVADGRMSVFDADGNEVAAFDLSERPGLQRTFTAVRALLTGDAAVLRDAFEVDLEARDDAGAWRMTLEPQGASAGYRLGRIVVDGTGHDAAAGTCRVDRIEVRQRDGGRRVIHLRPTGEAG